MKKYKHLRSAAVSGAVASAAVLVPLAAHAQEAGMTVLTMGWLHVSPIQHSSPLTDYITPEPVDKPLRLPSTFTSQGTSLHVSNTDTLGLSSSHFFTDHIAATLVGGIPPLVSIKGNGWVIPPGPAGVLGKLNIGNPALNPLIKSARAWTPIALLQYFFRDADAKVRPFLGAGVSYAWFTDIQPSNNTIAGIRQSLGQPLADAAGLPGQTQVQVKASTSWTPVVNAGLTWKYSPSLGLVASVTYVPLQTTAALYVKSAGGVMLAQAKSKVTIDPIIPYVGVTYSF
jgi:outer membrane protein